MNPIVSRREIRHAIAALMLDGLTQDAAMQEVAEEKCLPLEAVEAACESVEA